MPEGDSVALAAQRMSARLVGRRIVGTDLRVPRWATATLDGQTIVAFAPRGKHMLLRTDGGWTLHTHFRMDGSWTVLRPGRRLPAALGPDVRAVLHLDDGQTAVALRMPVVELVGTDEEDDVVGHLGPDLLDLAWGPAHEDEAVRRLVSEPGRPVVEALLDQRNLAGAGNLWAVETCFLRGVSPWAPAGGTDLRAHVRLLRRGLRHSVEHRTGQATTGSLRRGETHWVYGRAGRPCRRCATAISFRAGSCDAPCARETWWCPSCQPASGPPVPERA